MKNQDFLTDLKYAEKKSHNGEKKEGFQNTLNGGKLRP